MRAIAAYPEDLMALGYDDKLYILAFDHRASYVRKYFGVSGELSPADQERVEDSKNLIFDGMVIAAQAGEDPSVMGVLVDEQFGADIIPVAKKHGLRTAMPVERSGQDLFDFEYGDAFGQHIERFDADFAKILVRYNPDAVDRASNLLQLERLKVLSDWLHDHDRRFLVELLVPAEDAQLAAVGGDARRYDAELRPELMRRVIQEFQEAGIEADVWKIEGVDTTGDCQVLADQARAGGRDGVRCVVLGRGADDAQVDAWLQAAAGVDGFIGFAVGRSIWAAPLQAYLDGTDDRETAAAKIAANYTRFIEVYREAQ